MLTLLSSHRGPLSVPQFHWIRQWHWRPNLPWVLEILKLVSVASGFDCLWWRHFSTAIDSSPVLLPAVCGSRCVGLTQCGMLLQVWRRPTGDGLEFTSRNRGNRRDIVWGWASFSTQSHIDIDGIAKQSQAFGSVFKTGALPKIIRTEWTWEAFKGVRETLRNFKIRRCAKCKVHSLLCWCCLALWVPACTMF